MSTDKKTVHTWTVGDKIDDRYEIREIKTHGGMGIVYIMLDREALKQNRRIILAVKTFKDRFIWSERVVQKFFLEVEMWVKLGSHKNIVFAFYAKQIGGRPYLFMEYVDGASLREWIEKKRLSILHSVNFAIQICEGMIYAYDTMKIIHRDIKPENILITKTNVAKITDFGLVKIFDESAQFLTAEEKGDMRVLKPIRHEGWCTPAYTSPEQWVDARDVTTRSDIYCFGVMLYEMLTWRRPFYAATREELKFKHQHERPNNPKELNPSIPDALDSLVMKCLEKDPNNRCQSFGELKEELERINASLPGKKIPVEDIPFGLPPDLELLRTGFTLLNLKKYEEAEECFDQMLRIDPKNPEAWNNRGVCLKNLGKNDDALECFEKALELNPYYPQAWANKAGPYVDLGRYDEALECCNRSIEINVDWAEAWNNKAICLDQQNKYEQALECYDTAIEKDPMYWKAWINKALLLMRLNNLEKALECCDEAIKVNQREHFLWKVKGDVLKRLNRNVDSADCYDKALRLNPKYVEGAISFYDKAKALDPNDFLAYFNLGIIYMKLGDFDNAIMEFTKAIVLRPNFAVLYKYRGRVYRKIGRFDLAFTDFKKASKLDPYDREVQAALKELS